MKIDKYSQTRGGWSRIFDISCEHCNAHVCFYQKDGPGPLMRMYFDRMIGFTPTYKKLVCNKCNRELGLKIIFTKEKRPAYRLFQSSVNKKLVKRAVVE